MFEFKRGNKDSLEGRAILYVHNLMHGESQKDSFEYPALYTGNSLLDVLFPNEFFGTEAQIKEKEKQIRDSAKQYGAMDLLSIVREFTIENLKSLDDLQGDIIYVGDAPDFNASQHMLRGANFIYCTQYRTQLSGKIGSKKMVEEVPEINLNGLSGEGVMKKLYGLVGELYAARELMDSKKDVKARKQLLMLAENSKFGRQINGIIDAFSEYSPKSVVAIDLQIRLAGLIHSEDYRKAAICIKELDELLRQK